VARRPADAVAPGPGQESVWDYPRPPRAEPDSRRAVLRYADTVGAFLTPADRTTFCEWKGAARYVDVLVPGAEPLRDVGWWYPEPDRRYPQLRDRVAVYAGPFDEITLDGERIRPQPGGFYGGWITEEVVGPFKGGPGTWGW
jgi:uncharacterized protein (DUF427 family)